MFAPHLLGLWSIFIEHLFDLKGKRTAKKASSAKLGAKKSPSGKKRKRQSSSEDESKEEEEEEKEEKTKGKKGNARARGKGKGKGKSKEREKETEEEEAEEMDEEEEEEEDIAALLKASKKCPLFEEFQALTNNALVLFSF